MSQRMKPASPLRYPAFRYLAAGRVITMLGNALAPIALAFAVLDLTGSARDLGLVVAARSVTNVLFLLFGGVVADRLPRHLVMVASSALAAASQGVVAMLVISHHATVANLMILSAVNGLVSAFAFPAASALISQTVPGEILKQANAINRVGINTAMIAGASVGGFLVAVTDPGWGIAADAATFAVAGALFAAVRVGEHRGPAAASQALNPWRELRVGWSEFVSRTWVWVVVVGFCFFNAAEVGAVQVLGPAIADETFGRRVWGFVLAAETAGMVAGAFVAMRVRARRLLLVGMLSTAFTPVMLLVLGFGAAPIVLMGTAFLTGVALELFGIAWETSIQEHVSADRLARVYSYDALGSFLAIPAGQVAAGPLADAWGSRNTIFAAAGVVVVAIVGVLLSREVRQLEHRPATGATHETATRTVGDEAVGAGATGSAPVSGPQP